MSYEELQKGAVGRVHARQHGKVKVVVQDAFCSRAVGSGQVAKAVHEVSADANVVVGGCDGACFLAPRLVVETLDGKSNTYSHVTEAMAREIVLGSVEDLDLTLNSYHSLQTRAVLAHCGTADAESIDDYLARNGYQGLSRALAMTPEEVIAEVLAADVRGRGGAYFPAARKWQSARSVAKEPRYVVVNAEEGEPGIYKDRHVMEGDPHLIIEGLLIAGYASGASLGIIYVNAEAELSAERVRTAVDKAVESNLIGDDVLGSGFKFEVEIRRGAGGYVCGEETTLLNTIEGYRRVPRLRPPFPTESGVFDKPTVINNVETLCNVALAMRPEGLPDPATKLICLSGAVRHPGLVEVSFGVTLRDIVFGIGGGPPEGSQVVGVVAGGPSGGLLPVSMLDTAIKPGLLHETGAVAGSGGIVVFDDSISIPGIVRKLAAYNASESCGKCTPCREGTPRMVQVIDRLIAGFGNSSDVSELHNLSRVVSAASLCGLGQMAGGPINSGLYFFEDDFAKLTNPR